MRVVQSLVALAVVLVPTLAAAAPPKAQPAGRTPRTARIQKMEKADKGDKADKAEKADKPGPKTCLKPTVEIAGAGDKATFSLTKCDGTAIPVAVDQISIMARPGSAPKPKVTIEALGKGRGRDVAPGIRRLDPRLVERLEAALDHFRKAGQTPKLEILSGYRPKSSGSYHQSGRALDVRIDGVSNEALVAFCKTLPDTGCGYYPNSLFVHIDVRDAGAGHVAWIDASRPGEAPRYVTAWPPPRPGDEAARLPSLPDDDQAIAREQDPAERRRLDRHPYVF
jgi:uncharacterized protein YcbK (DUF882 family)